MKRLFKWWNERKTSSSGRLSFEVRYKVEERDVLVGTLSNQGEEFVFRYAQEYLESGLPLLPDFPVDQEYRSTGLWPFFDIRIPSQHRGDIQALMIEQGLANNTGTMELLEAFGRRVLSNPYELIPVRG